MAKPCTLAPEAAARLLKGRAKTLRKTLGAVSVADVDGVHDMRVASRRLRAVLAEHSAVLDNAAFEGFRKLIRQVTRLLGAPRELDVCIEMLEKRRAQYHGPTRLALNHAVRQLREKRTAEAKAVAQAAALVAAPEFDQGLMTLFEGLRPQASCYVKEAAANLKEQYHALYRIHGLWESVPSEPILHRIRVCFKKLRYACEAYAPLYGPSMDAFLGELKAAQEALGLWNDGRVLRDYLVEMIPEAPPKSKEGLPMLVASIETEVAHHLEAFAVSAKPFFSHQHARDVLDLFAHPQMSCCRSKAPDLEALDAAY